MSAKKVPLRSVCTQDRASVRPGERGDLTYLGLEGIEADTGLFVGGDLSKTPETPQANSFLFDSRHVLYGKLRPYLNKVAVPEAQGKCSTEIVPLLPARELNRQYLAYYLRSPSTVAQITDRSAGARMPRADMDFVLSLEIPLLHLDEQRRIVDILSRAEGIVRLRREAHRKAAELIPAIFIDMFGDPGTNPNGWSIVPMGELVGEFRYGTSQKSGPVGVPVLRIPNVVGGAMDLTEVKLVSLATAEHERLRLLNGDLLFVRTNGNPDFVGRCSVYDSKVLSVAGFDGSECVYASYLIRARLSDSRVSPAYLQAYLSSQRGRQLLRERAKTSAGQFNLNIDGLGSLPVPVPPQSLQRKFTESVDRFASVVSQQDSAQAAAGALFRSLLARAFGAGQ
jgi:type I restriction enzyme S subunit